jgi:hypothetical protein
LIEMDRLGFRGVELAVLDAGACSHALELPRTEDGPVAEAVLMAESPFEDIGDDFHVPVTVHAEALTRLDPVFVDDPEHAKAYVSRVVIVAEGESVVGIYSGLPTGCTRE